MQKAFNFVQKWSAQHLNIETGFTVLKINEGQKWENEPFPIRGPSIEPGVLDF
jgi:hypothetical protein